MGMKILWQDIYPEIHPIRGNIGIVWEGLKQLARKVVRPDTEVNLAHVDKFCGSVMYPYLEMLNVGTMVDRALKAEKQGYDAVMMGCFLDPGLQQVRGLVDIPVTFPFESSMLLAQMLGRKMAIVTTIEESIPILEQKVHFYGLESKMISNKPIRVIEYWEPLLECFQGRSERLVRDFEKASLGCIGDGADVIIAGCVYLGAALTLAGYCEVSNSGVPTVDVATTALKMAELLTDLRRTVGLTRSTSKTSIYQKPPSEMLAEVRKTFGF